MDILIFTLLFVFLVTCHCVRYEDPKFKCPEKEQVIYPCVCDKGSDSGLYLICENVNLATLSVALQNVHTLNTKTFSITIQKGNFARLYGHLFAKTNAQQLIIKDVPLKVIEEYTFFGINDTLEEIHMINTNLTTFPSEAFGILSKLSLLNINGHGMVNLSKDIFYEKDISNHLETLRITNGLLSDIPVESFQPLRKLKILDLHGNNLTILKRNQFKNLRDVESLDISFNNITKLESQHIADLTKLGWCNVSNNAIKDLPRGTFARNSVLKVLNLSHNMIQRLDANSFRGMRFLRRLYLNDNKLSDIGRGTFGAITRIGTIDLARNSLKKIEFQMFSQLNYVEILDISENNITMIEKHSFKDIYQSKINISYNAIEQIESLSFENCVNITVLDLSNNRLTNFEKSTFDDTTFATELQLSHNFFTDLSQVPLQNMTGLKILNVSYNILERIPKNSFPKLYELHTIDLAYNNISFIYNGVFQMLFSLRLLNLSHNNLEEVKTSVFGTMPTLLELDLSHNKLNAIARGALAKLTSLRKLKLDHNYLEKVFQIPISLNEFHLANNKINSLPAETWPVMNSLLFLDLTGNEIGDSLQSGSFTGLLVLQTLLLNRNNITYPPTQSLTGLSTLQYLHLEENKIAILNKNAFGKLPVLFHLNLYKNGIREVRKQAFEGLLQLLVLNLSSNALDNIPTETFRGLPSLRTLDLSHNRLTKLDNKTNGVLDDLLSLEKLNLSHNQISFVTKKTFPSNQYIPYNLKELDLSYNLMPVLTYDIVFGTKKLIKLNLSHNAINDIRKGVLGNISSLENLDLSYNNLTDLMSENIFSNLPTNLKVLNIRNNQIFRIPFEDISKQVMLKIFDLRFNNLEIFPLSLLETLKNGTEVLFQGNPLYCNCGLRPLKHYFLSKRKISKNELEIKCFTPGHLRNISLNTVPDESLQCSSMDNINYKGEMYDVLPDVRFRDYKKNGTHVIVRWFVVSKKDLAEFSVYVRNQNNEIFYQKEADYDERSVDIPIVNIRKARENGNHAEICIIAKDSNGIIGKWFESQCMAVPDLSKKNFRESFWGQNSSLSLVSDFILIFSVTSFAIFWSIRF